jgi:hypothetical protein
MPVSCQVSKRAYIYLLEILLLFLVLRFVARFWNCSEGVVFLAFQFLINKVEHDMQYALNKHIAYVFYLLQRVRIPLRRGELDTTLCDKVCQWLPAGRWFSPGTPVSSINKTNHHDITEIWLFLQRCVVNFVSFYIIKLWVHTIDLTRLRFIEVPVPS